jgi:HAE1 family hydrophobic/amphiphilic exporter-1
LVDYTKLLRARGLAFYDAVTEAGKSRLRPVMMTSFTTMLAMLPMSLSQGTGHELWSPFGITIIGGLLISMFVSLFFVPLMYVIINYKESKKMV